MKYSEIIAIFEKLAQKVDEKGYFYPIVKTKIEAIEEWLNEQHQKQQQRQAWLDLRIERMRKDGATLESIKDCRIVQNAKIKERFANFRFIKNLYDEYRVMRAAYLELKKRMQVQSDSVLDGFANFVKNLNLK